MNKKISYSLIIIVLLIVGSFVFINFKKAKRVAIYEVPSHIVRVENYTDKRQTQYVSLNISYPQFTNIDPAFNEKIKSMIESAARDHEELSKKNWIARRETALPGEDISEFPEPDLFSFAATWTEASISEDLISIVFRYGGFSGGAHGYEAVATFNYDVKNKKDMVLADVFPNDKNYLQTISAHAIAELKEQYKANGIEIDEHIADVLNQGAGPVESNFKNFTLKDNTITFYFEQYQVGPYVFGMPEVTMNIKK